MSKRKVIVFGCSFTAQPEAWPHFLNDEFDVVNYAHPGAGNTRIRRVLMHMLPEHINENPYVIVQWSGLFRRDFMVDPNELTDDEEHFPFSLNGNSYPTGVPYWSSFGGHPYCSELIHGESLFGEVIDNKARAMMQLMNYEHQYFKTLENILLTQIFLDKYDVKYMMFNWIGDIQHKTYNTEKLFDLIDWKRYWFHHYKGSSDRGWHNQYIHSREFCGMGEWIMDNIEDKNKWYVDFPPGAEHPVDSHPSAHSHELFSNEVRSWLNSDLPDMPTNIDNIPYIDSFRDRWIH